MKFLGKKEILDVDDLKLETVEVPEWGGCVNIRMLTGSERDAFEGSILQTNSKSKVKNYANIRARLAQISIVDEKDNSLFSELDIAALGRKSAKALDRIFDAAQKLNGMTEDDIEELAKNSATDQSEDSTSG